jgi:hypothetical protein
MTLREQQSIFALNISKLIIAIYDLGLTVTLGEAWRPQVTANYYASMGTGSKNSLHLDRLAVDLNVFRDGSLLQNNDPIWQNIGTIWKEMDPANAAGMDFTGQTAWDMGHFSMSYQGRK